MLHLQFETTGLLLPVYAKNNVPIKLKELHLMSSGAFAHSRLLTAESITTSCDLLGGHNTLAPSNEQTCDFISHIFAHHPFAIGSKSLQ